MTWNQQQAVELCRKVEPIVAQHGCHVALTGGVLYKDGQRKDCDLIIYRAGAEFGEERGSFKDTIDRTRLLCDWRAKASGLRIVIASRAHAALASCNGKAIGREREMAPQDFNYWLNTVRGSTRGLSEAQELEAAGICAQTADDAAPLGGVGAWHAAALAAGNVARCQCARCRPDITRYL